jgi:hypothetical protein
MFRRVQEDVVFAEWWLVRDDGSCEMGGILATLVLVQG